MSIEVRCAGCQQVYLLDPEMAGAELACPACSTPMQVGIDRPAAQPQAPATPSAQAPPVQPAAPAANAGTVVLPPGSEVVCPRCNLHFRPRTDGPNATVPNAETPTILVVEDMSYFREAAADALGGSYSVKTATTVDEARTALSGGGIDLLLLDLTLDGGDHGVDLLRELQPKPCPILIYMAENESDIYGDGWEEIRVLGADDIVVKGLNVGEILLRKVGALLGREEEDLVDG